MTTGTAYEQVINRTIAINAPPAQIWTALTTPTQMMQWMSPDTELEIITDWTVGQPMIIRAPWYKTTMENKGTVLQFVPNQRLQYSHLSSLSHLADEPGNYCIITFMLAPAENSTTTLSLSLTNFPTEAIYRHFAFYWGVTLHMLKKFAEMHPATNYTTVPLNLSGK